MASYTGYVKKLPIHDLSRATEIRDFALKTFPIESSKGFIVRLNACCNWAVKSGLIDVNPFSGMAAEIKPPKSQRSEDEDIDPFSIHERNRIIEAIAYLETLCPQLTGNPRIMINLSGRSDKDVQTAAKLLTPS